MLYHLAHTCPVAFKIWVWLYACNKLTIFVEENRLSSIQFLESSELLCVLYGADVSVSTVLVFGDEYMGLGFHHIYCRISDNQLREFRGTSIIILRVLAVMRANLLLALHNISQSTSLL